MTTETGKARRSAPLKTPNPLSDKKVRELSGALNLLLADAFALYLKTKNFHWHVSGPHFRDYHLLLDEQADQIFAITDTIAERVRKIGGMTIRSIGHIGRTQRVLDNRLRIKNAEEKWPGGEPGHSICPCGKFPSYCGSDITLIGPAIR